MATIVGNLKINIAAGTAELENDLNQLPGKAGRAGKGMQDAFNNSRGGLMLLEDSLGVRLPRHLNNLIAKLPGLGQAFSAALPVAGVAIAGEKILELIEHMAALSGKQDELVRKADEVARAWVDSSRKIQDEITAEEAKILSLSNGAVAGFEYAFEHAASVAIGHLKDIDSQIDATAKHIAESGNWFTGMASRSTEASEDLKNFNNELNNAMQTAELNSNGDKFAAIRAGLSLAADKADKLQGKIKDMHDAQTHGGQAEDVMYKDREDNYKKEADAIDNVIRRLNQLSNLQAGTNAAHGSEGAALKVEEFNKIYAAEKAASDAATKEVIADYELQFAEGKITAVQLGNLRQAALDKEYDAERSHFETLKEMDAGRPEALKQVLAQEATLEAQHATEIINADTKALDDRRKSNNELIQISTDQFNQSVALQTKESEATFKGIELRAMAKIKDSELIKAQGNQKIAAIDDEIRNLERLKAQYKLTGQAKIDVDNAIHKLALQRQKDQVEELLSSKKLGDNFHGTLLKMVTDGQNWHTKLAEGFGQSVGQMNQSLADFVTTGRGNFASLAQGAASSFINMAISYGESKLEMWAIEKLFGTKKAAANAGMAQSNTAVGATNALASVPFPANISAAAETEALGQVLSAGADIVVAERGGIMGDFSGGMPAILHKKEMVLPERIASKVINMAESSKSDNTNGNAQHATYAPTIHAPMASAAEIDARLKGHFDRWARSEARKRYTRTN